MLSRQSGTKDGDGVGCGGRSVVIAVSHTKYCSVVQTLNTTSSLLLCARCFTSS